ncbi:MAG: glycosyltransferase [Terrimicrobiaceae bacterium]
MKICDLTQFYSPVSGGVRRYIGEKAAHVKRQGGRDQHVLVVPGETTGCEGDDLTKIYTIASPLVSRTSRYRMLLKLHLVEEVLERERPDIIESGDPYQLAWKAIASGRALGIPVVGFYHSHFPEALLRTVAKFTGGIAPAIASDAARRYVKTLYNRFETTFVPSPALAALLTSWGVDSVDSIDLGVDTHIFRPGDVPVARLRKDLGLPPDKRILLYVGRLAPEKNVQTLFSAFSLLRNQADCHLVVVGDGTQRSSVERLKKRTGAVTWIPYCGDPGQLANIYRAADLFVHPGIQETFGLVTLESQACGTPVVGIRGSYMDRIIFSDQISWARDNTPTSLAEAIEAKLGRDLVALGKTAGEAVRSNYSWEKIFDHIFRVYTRVVDNYCD